MRARVREHGSAELRAVKSKGIITLSLSALHYHYVTDVPLLSNPKFPTAAAALPPQSSLPGTKKEVFIFCYIIEG